MLPQDQTKSAATQPNAAAGKDPKAATRTATTKSTGRAGPRKAAAAAGLSDELQRRIQQRAYELWEHEGRPEGRDDAHWAQAEREIVGRRPSGRA